jgi:hypothetical protein
MVLLFLSFSKHFVLKYFLFENLLFEILFLLCFLFKLFLSFCKHLFIHFLCLQKFLLLFLILDINLLIKSFSNHFSFKFVILFLFFHAYFILISLQLRNFSPHVIWNFRRNRCLVISLRWLFVSQFNPNIGICFVLDCYGLKVIIPLISYILIGVVLESRLQLFQVLVI